MPTAISMNKMRKTMIFSFTRRRRNHLEIVDHSNFSRIGDVKSGTIFDLQSSPYYTLTKSEPRQINWCLHNAYVYSLVA